MKSRTPRTPDRACLSLLPSGPGEVHRVTPYEGSLQSLGDRDDDDRCEADEARPSPSARSLYPAGGRIDAASAYGSSGPGGFA